METNYPPIFWLPRELIDEITSHLNYVARCQLIQASSFFRSQIKKPQTPARYKSLKYLLIDYPSSVIYDFILILIKKQKRESIIGVVAFYVQHLPVARTRSLLIHILGKDYLKLNIKSRDNSWKILLKLIYNQWPIHKGAIFEDLVRWGLKT